MGKPSSPKGGKAADAVSLHTNPGESSRDNHGNDDLDVPETAIDDLPPTYHDALESSEDASLLPSTMAPSNSAPVYATRPWVEDATFSEDVNTGAQYWMARSLENPKNLKSHIEHLAAIPPRPYIKLVGTHTETTRDSKGKTEKNTITDFDVSVELTPYLYSDAQYRRSWSHLRTVENGEKTKRGTILKKRAPGSNQSIEVGGDPKPTLEEWCHRYAASHAGLKVFALSRRMVGFDEEGIKYRLRTMVNDTNYRGHLKVEIITKDSLVECYNEAKTNKWRLTSWIQMLFTFTLLFIFSWPYLWLRTKRWEVAVAEWPFSRMAEGGTKEYVSISEDQWYNLWGRAICKAVLEKRQGVLDQNDLRRAQEAEPAFETGHAVVDGALGLFRASVGAMNEVNRQLGWGRDC
ncbi:uncharacterized protein F4822DRAFT_193267 [Hypoxylon trugodes]|uniref:uncharacterized protein n=1 Tax=Hypoxylon trugodes TaxID=326681 RepID=UPI00219039D0|nr:uncharacterized protein F4822DRAFT_193267 [Hypoxylon trugodes]KAI1391706.1 hypothetical protein F4822DRAFT_193267 [Hypoxylon trugodes]